MNLLYCCKVKSEGHFSLMVDLLGEGGRRTIGARHHAVKLIPNYEITIFEEDEAV